MPKPIAEVVVSGHSADVVSGWLSGSKRAKPEVADEPTEDFQPRASRLGIGAKFVAHKDAITTSSKAQDAVEKAMKKARRRAEQHERDKTDDVLQEADSDEDDSRTAALAKQRKENTREAGPPPSKKQLKAAKEAAKHQAAPKSPKPPAATQADVADAGPEADSAARDTTAADLAGWGDTDGWDDDADASAPQPSAKKSKRPPKRLRMKLAGAAEGSETVGSATTRASERNGEWSGGGWADSGRAATAGGGESAEPALASSKSKWKTLERTRADGRKKTKTRSKQKNLRKDTRPDWQKPGGAGWQEDKRPSTAG